MESGGLPNTLYNTQRFEEAQWSIECPYCGSIIGFDGTFDWGWMLDLLPRGITPTDIDSVIEMGLGHFLVFETKLLGMDISTGQNNMLRRLHNAKSFVVVRMWLEGDGGVKRKVHHFDWIKRNGTDSGITKYGVDEARHFLQSWINFVEPKGF